VFEVLLAILVMPTLGWRWLLGLSTIPLFIFSLLCFVSMTSSPDALRYVAERPADCLLSACGAVAPRERSVRRAEREPGQRSGHAEAHRLGERSPDAAGPAGCCQTGEPEEHL